LGAFLSAENDKDPRTNEQAVRRWFRRMPVQVIDLICLLDSIGLKLQIVPRDAIGAQVESKSKPKESDEKWLN
jgi:hypothetical protein